MPLHLVLCFSFVTDTSYTLFTVQDHLQLSQLQDYNLTYTQGTAEELKAKRLLPQQAKDNLVEKILEKISIHDEWVKTCRTEAATNIKVLFVNTIYYHLPYHLTVK